MEKLITREQEAIILDYLPNGYPFDNRPHYKKTPVAQAIGLTRFTLLELVPKKDITLQPGDKVYIGDGKREQIHHIMGKLSVLKLTSTAKSEMEFVIKDLIDKKEKIFVEFFNKAQPLSTRMHQLELLPGLGKKHMWAVLEARDEKEFESFKEIKERVKLIPDPKQLLIKRILSEISGEEKYKLFTD
jgi:putative nucleotide binding protein